MPVNSEQMEALVHRLEKLAMDQGRACQFHYDHAFAQLLHELRPRISYLIKHYGLADMREDAEQVCAIAVHRALESYDRTKAKFTTHVTWMLRGELQGLRHRVRLDHRKSAQTAGIRTVSLESLSMPNQPGLTFEIVDDRAEQAMHHAVRDLMARRSLGRLMKHIGSPESEQIIVKEGLDETPRCGSATLTSSNQYSAEQRRQIVRRTYRNCAKVAAA